VLLRHSVDLLVASCVFTASLVGCSAAGDDPRAGLTTQAIINGDVVTNPDAPVLYMRGPQGTCTATLVAPNLVVTARHCVAETGEGQFTCTSAGDLVINGGAGGQIGANDPSSALEFYTNARVVAGTVFNGTPDAVGTETISTNTTTSCKDDLAFEIITPPITSISPAALRLDDSTYLNESVSAWGYGLTASSADPLALRVRSTATITGVGYDMPTSATQLAPIRAVRVGPDDITCNGDSGGPITSNVTGAVIAIASLGAESSTAMPACTSGGAADTTGPRLGAYEQLALMAFGAAGATPVLEPGETPLPTDAGAGPGDAGQTESGGPVEAGTGVTPQNEPPEMPPNYQASGGSCAIAPGDANPSQVVFSAGVLTAAAALRGRRRARKR